jgi:hypothetical protein
MFSDLNVQSGGYAAKPSSNQSPRRGAARGKPKKQKKQKGGTFLSDISVPAGLLLLNQLFNKSKKKSMKKRLMKKSMKKSMKKRLMKKSMKKK